LETKKTDRRAAMDAAIAQQRAELPAPRYLDTVQAAAYLGITRKQLESWRSLGCGPAYCKVGRLVRYSVADLDAWMAERRVLNTAQAAQAVAT
jgi:predicted DNA-binding transcriptional regulator AlpA